MQTNTNTPIHSRCAPAFAAVEQAFRFNFEHDIEVGASFCAYVGGERVVDLWGGHKDREQTSLWQENTLVNLYSTTKGLTCIALAALLDDAVLDVQMQVRELWPELLAAQDGLTLGQMLSHQGGLAGLSETITTADLYNWPKMIGLLEQQEPLWAPGTNVGYHAMTWGYLLGEMVRRASGQTLAQVFAERVVQPLQADVHLAVPSNADLDISPLIGPNHARALPASSAEAVAAGEVSEPAPLSTMVMTNPIVRPYQDASSAVWRQAEIAAANGQGNARSVAKLYAAVASSEEGGELQGTKIVSQAALEALCAPLVSASQSDLVLGYGLNRGSGFILNTNAQYGPNTAAFGHSGAGGSIGFADPTAQVAVGYAMNQMQPGAVETTRAARLISALYDCL